MAYDSNYYEPPQRPYAARPQSPASSVRSFGRPAPQGYAQEQYGYQGRYDDGYNNAPYGQDQGGQYPPPRMNGAGPGGGYPPRGGYQPEYNNGSNGPRNGPPPGGMPPGGRGPYPRQPPPERSYTPQGRRGPEYGGPGSGAPPRPPPGQGMPRDRPPPLERDHAAEQSAMPSPTSPPGTSWDNPFPTFPSSKTYQQPPPQQEQMSQMMDNMSINGNARHMNQRPSPPQSMGRPSIDSQRSAQSKYSQGTNNGYGSPPDSRRQQGPPPGPAGSNGYRSRPGPNDDFHQARPRPGPNDDFNQGRPRPGPNDDFNQARPRPGPNDDFNQAVPPSPMRSGFAQRANTMPHDVEPMHPPARSYTQQSQHFGDLGPSAPYNGPVGRNTPPRPSTSTGVRQPPPRRQYEQPSQLSADNLQPTANGHEHSASADQGWNAQSRISYFYDAYYELPHGRGRDGPDEMPPFEHAPSGNQPAPRRGMSIDQPRPSATGGMPPLQQTNSGRPSVEQPNDYINRTKSQPDLRARAQPQAAVFEMATDAPPLPAANQFHPPPQAPPSGALPSTPAPPKLGVARTNTMPNPTPSSDDVLPAHPTPVRPGQIPNSIAQQAANRPPPVRNYGNINAPAAIPPPMSAQMVKSAPAAPPPQQVKPMQPAPRAPQSPPAPPPVTHAELEQLRLAVRNNPNDQNATLVLARKLVEAADVLVPSIPDPKTRNRTRERYILDAHKLLKKLAQMQNPEAMFFLADCHGRGSLGLEADNKEAFNLYQSAAKLGHPAAAYRTAVCCELGSEEGGGTRKDPLKAIQWYQRAATLGDTPAMYKMGMIQLKGLLGQPRNPRDAVSWLKRAADKADPENPHALHELGLLYESAQPSDHIIRDEAYALQLFNKGADMGYKFSQFRLGCAYEYGLMGVAIDPRTSIMWYSRAAIQEEHQSELALSGWYLTGSDGVLQQSDTEAYLWARKAALAGLGKAEYAMGYFTEVGIGTERDIEGAKRWYWRAAAQNFPKARERLEDLKRGGSKPQLKTRERYSRSKVGKQNEGECTIM